MFNFLRKNVWPIRELINNFIKSESDFIDDSNSIFFRDVYDHTIQIIDNIESLRETSSGLTDLYMTSVSNKMNSVMQVLTIIATIFIPLTFFAGIYGMNFKYMPELEWKYSYPALLILMFITAGFMLYFFKKKKWF
jgi:magnesium transporter